MVIGVLSLALAACARIPTPEEANDAVLTLREYESWAWALGIVLIWADVFLPVPQTAVIAALGIVYGTLPGGLLGSLGLITGGLLGYALIRSSARRYVQRVVTPSSLHKMERLFDQNGAWAIVLTRSLPYSIPEVMVFLAGLAGMPPGKLIAALIIGSVPTAFVFAAIGAGWAHQPILALGASYLLPIALLPIALYLMRRQTRSEMSSPRAPLVANLVAAGLYVFALACFSGLPTGVAALLLAASGASLAGAGVALVLRSRAELGRAWSLLPTADRGTGFVTTGPYRLVRHPIYVGLALLVTGGALALGSRPALVIVLCAIVPSFAWRARTEEKVLNRTFGERYADYQQRTRMFVPYLF